MEENIFRRGPAPQSPDEAPDLQEKLARAEESQDKLKKIIESLMERESHYRTLAQLCLDMVFIVGEDWRVQFVNDFTAGFLGMATEDIKGRPFEEIFPPGRFKLRETDLKKVFRSGEPLFLEKTISYFGREVCLDTRLIPVRDKDGTVCSVLGIARDITERRQREETIKKEEEFLTNVFESIQDAVAIMDGELTILRSNRVMDELCGSGEPLAGRKCYELAGKERPCEGCISLEVLLSGRSATSTVKSGDLCVKKVKNGGWIEFHMSPLTGEGGQVSGVVAIMRDVTSRRMIEAELQRAQRLESLAALSGGIAHEFNNILTMIMGNIALSKLYPVTGEMKDILNEAEKASVKGRDIANQMLAFSKTGEMAKKAMEVEGLLRNAVSLSAAAISGKQESNRFELLLPGGLWPVMADEGQIMQAVNNLLMNARQAMPEGGPITVKAANVSIKTGELPLLEEGDYVEISFEDRGPTIPAEDLLRIFDPFFATGLKDPGFGLAVAYSIVKKHGGCILAESGQKGRTFKMYLPALSGLKAPAKDEGKEEDRFNPVYTRGNILLMDDEEGVRVVIGRMLEQCGYDVDLANDGDAAIGMYGAALGAGNPYDAVILDLVVARGPDGKETARRLMAIDPGARIIAATGNYTDPAMTRFGDYGFKDVLAKPFLVEELNQVLGKVIKK